MESSETAKMVGRTHHRDIGPGATLAGVSGVVEIIISVTVTSVHPKADRY